MDSNFTLNVTYTGGEVESYDFWSYPGVMEAATTCLESPVVYMVSVYEGTRNIASWAGELMKRDRISEDNSYVRVYQE